MTEPLSFGLSLANRSVLFGTPVNSLLAIAEQAEASGYFDSVWVGDNFLSKPRLEAVVILSAIAARTARVRLGTICLASFPLRHPLQFAIEWASLDIVSGGRTILVVCNGTAASVGPNFASELAAFDVRSRDRVARLEEGIEILRQAWSDGPVNYHGRFYHFENIEVLPKPVRDVPIAIAVNPGVHGRPTNPEFEERALRRVARLADGWQTVATPPEQLHERWMRIQEYAAEYDRAGRVNHLSLHLMVNINDDVNAAYAEGASFLGEYYGQGTDMHESLTSWLAFGPPDVVIEKIGRYIDAGCTTPVLRFASTDQQGQFERCVRDVMPIVRQQHMRGT